MGLDERASLQRAGFNVTERTDRAVADHLSAPPIGCRYYDSSGTFMSISNNTTTTMDFRATAGNVQYDPYKMIDVTNDTVTIPFPGIWDLAFEVIADSATIASGDGYMAQFAQGTLAASGLVQNQDSKHAARISSHICLQSSQPFLVTRSELGSGSLWRLRCYQINDAATVRSMKIVTFSMWLRSAHIPGRY